LAKDSCGGMRPDQLWPLQAGAPYRTRPRREIVDLGINPSEAEPFWSAFSAGPSQAQPQGRQGGDLLRPPTNACALRSPGAWRQLATLSRALDA
jgi:hypothetical protein